MPTAVRRNRSRAEPTELLRAHVLGSTRAAFVAAAAESGISLGLYLELLSAQLRDQDGQLPVLIPRLVDESEADLKISA